MKSILLAFFIITTSMYAAEITKDQASVIGAAVGSGIGIVAGDLLQPYTGQYTKTISTIAGAAAGTYVAQQLHKDTKPKSTKEGKTK